MLPDPQICGYHQMRCCVYQPTPEQAALLVARDFNTNLTALEESNLGEEI